jgi:simple sugar transport system permease protein
MLNRKKLTARLGQLMIPLIALGLLLLFNLLRDPGFFAIRIAENLSADLKLLIGTVNDCRNRLILY